MPTPTGLPKPGEVWAKTTRLPPDWKPHVTVFKVKSRGRGEYWSMHVEILTMDGESPSVHFRHQHWVDCAYWMSKGELEFVK